MSEEGLREPAGGRKPHNLTWVGLIHKQKFMELDVECIRLYVLDPQLEKVEKHEELISRVITNVFLSVSYVPGIK